MVRGRPPELNAPTGLGTLTPLLRYAWQCFHCEASSSDARPDPCDCGTPDSWVRSIPQAPVPRQRIEATSVPRDSSPRLSTGYAELDALMMGGLRRTGKMLLYGSDGKGKSRAALRIVTSIGPALFLSLEMPLELAVETAEHCGAQLPGLYIVSELDGWRDEAKGCTSIVLDSISVAPRPVSLLSELAEWADTTRGVVIALCQVNKNGKALGPNKLRHWSDYVIRASSGSAPGRTSLRVEKSRYCPPGVVEVPIIR